MLKIDYREHCIVLRGFLLWRLTLCCIQSYNNSHSDTNTYQNVTTQPFLTRQSQMSHNRMLKIKYEKEAVNLQDIYKCKSANILNYIGCKYSLNNFLYFGTLKKKVQ